MGDARRPRQAVRHHQLDPARGAGRRPELPQASRTTSSTRSTSRAGTSSLEDVVTYQFRFRTAPIQRVDPADLAAPPGGGKEFFAQLAGAYDQTYTVTKIVGRGGNASQERVIAQDVPVAPPRIGPRTQAVANALGLAPYTSPAYDDAFAATFVRDLGAEGRVFAGPRDDPFYVDLGGIFDLANLRPKGMAQDGVAGFNVAHDRHRDPDPAPHRRRPAAGRHAERRHHPRHLVLGEPPEGEHPPAATARRAAKGPGSRCPGSACRS